MAGFTSPSILFIQTWDGPERDYAAELLPKLRSRYSRYVEPAVGGFAMPLVALDAGWKPAQMETSDVHLFTSILGEMNAGRDMSGLRVTIDDEPVEFQSSDPIDQAAQLLFLQYLTRTQARPQTHYWLNMIEDLQTNEDFHLATFREQLTRMSKRLHGLAYRPRSLWEHLDEALDDPNALIISNPPTYRGAYEKFFDTKGRLAWDAPEYDVFDAKVDIPRMVEMAEGRPGLLVVQQQQEPGHAAHARPVYARQLSAGQLVFINSNRPKEIEDLLGGLRVVRRKLSPLGERPWPIIPKDHAIDLDAKVQLVEVEAKVADAYRREWMHRLYPVQGSGNVMVLIDGYAAGVIGYSLATLSSSYSRKWEKHVILRFAFGAKHEGLRLTRLATMLALQHSTLWLTQTPLNTMHIASAEGLVTVEMTRHPEAKGLRGLMKLDNRQKHPDGFKLVYVGDWMESKDPSGVLADFLSKEQTWLQSTRRG